MGAGASAKALRALCAEANRPEASLSAMNLEEAKGEISRLRQLLAKHLTHPQQYYDHMDRYIVTRSYFKPKHLGPRQLQLQEGKLRWELQKLKQHLKLPRKKPQPTTVILEQELLASQRVACTAKLCAVLREQGKLKSAEHELRDLLLICVNTLPPNHHDTVSVATQLSSILCAMDKIVAAKNLASWAFRSSWQEEGQFHPRTLIVMKVLGQIVRKQALIVGSYAEEEERLLRLVVQGCHSCFGATNPETFSAVSNLSSFCWRYGKLDDAEMLLRRHLSGLPDDSNMRFHPIVLKLVHDLIELVVQKRAHGSVEYDPDELLRLQRWENVRSGLEQERLASLALTWEKQNTGLLEHAKKTKAASSSPEHGE